MEGHPDYAATRTRPAPAHAPRLASSGIVSCWIRRRSRATSCHGVGDGVPDGGMGSVGYLWVAARSAAAHSRDLRLLCLSTVF